MVVERIENNFGIIASKIKAVVLSPKSLAIATLKLYRLNSTIKYFTYLWRRKPFTVSNFLYLFKVAICTYNNFICFTSIKDFKKCYFVEIILRIMGGFRNYFRRENFKCIINLSKPTSQLFTVKLSSENCGSTVMFTIVLSVMLIDIISELHCTATVLTG